MQDELEEKSGESFDWKRYAKVIRRRRWYFLLPLFFGWLIVWGVSWVLPSVYRSGTLILVEQPSVPQQYVVSNVNDKQQDQLASISQQILSRTRLLHIIESLNLYSKYAQHVSRDELVERMGKNIEIELVRSPDLQELSSFNVYFSYGDPVTAQQVTSELTNLFISENLEVRQQQSENTTKFLENQLEEARATLSAQEAKIRAFKDQHLGELPGQLQSNLQILTGLQAQLQSEQDALNRAKQQNVYLESLLGQYRSLNVSTKTGESVSIGLPAIDKELDLLRGQLADLSSHYTERHPDVRKLEEQIAKTEKLKQQIATDLKNKTPDPADGDSAVAPSSDADDRAMSPAAELGSQLKANQIEIGTRQRSIQELQSKIGGYQGRLNQAPVREQQLADLSRGYEQSQANYDSLLKKKNDSQLSTNLESRQQGEHFRILDPPSLPVKPHSPNRLKLCGVGLALGIFLGGAASIAAEKVDDRLYSEEELKKLIPVGIISQIPNVVTASEQTKQRRQDRLVWVTAIAVFASIAVGSAYTYFRG